MHLDKNQLNSIKNAFTIIVCFLIIIFCSFCGGSSDSTTSDPNTLTLSPTMVNGTASTNSEVRDCAIDSNGDIYCTGIVENFESEHKDIFVVKITSSHTLDGSWGTNGYVILNPGSPANDEHDEKDTANAITIYNDSLIIVGKSTKSSSTVNNKHALIVMLDKSTGAYDTGFNGSGIFIFDENAIAGDPWNRDFHFDDLSKAEEEAEAVAVDASGNIYVAGSATKMLDTDNVETAHNIFALKLSSTGILDMNFDACYDTDFNIIPGTDGVFCFNGSEDKGDKAKDMVIDTANNKIYIAGSTQQTGINDGDDTFSILKLNTSDGSFDATFGANGIATVEVDGTTNSFNSEANAIILNGSVIYATGTGERTTDTDYDMIIAAKNTDGTPVTTFNDTNGYYCLPSNYLGEDEKGKDIAIGPNGSIYVAGFIENGDNNDRMVWIFDDSGVRTGEVTVNPDGYDDALNCIAVDADGNLILGGYKDDIKSIVWFQEIE